MTEGNYTIYANKPESYGRHEEYYGDTIFAFELDSDDILDIVTRCMVTNLELRPSEKGWEIVILFEGHPISEEERSSIFAIATPKAQKQLDDYKTEQTRLAEEKKQKIIEDNEQRQRATYEALKKKFEPQF